MTAFLALWNDIERGREPEYDTWHTREHVPERVSSPGFISGTRFVDRGHAVHRYFTFYEVQGLDAFHTPQYLDLLQNPTPWSAAMRPSFRNFLRVPCSLAHHAGFGRGAALAVLRLTGPADPAAPLAALLDAPGIVAVTLGRAADQAVGVAWGGPKPVEGATAPFDSVLLVQALDRAAAQRAHDAALAGFGITPDGSDIGGVYDLASIFPGADPGERRAHRRPGWADFA